jgi:putative addiction module CopG family antidote
MRKLNVSLSDEFVDFVERELASGEYASASEVVRDGLIIRL